MQQKELNKKKELTELKYLLEIDAISQEEFERNKHEILSYGTKEIPDKKNTLLLISFVLTAIYLIFAIGNWISTISQINSDAGAAGASLATLILLPHYILVFVAFIFNGIGVFMKKRGFALTGAILYTIALVVMPIYFLFIIIQMILSYIGYSQMGKV